MVMYLDWKTTSQKHCAEREYKCLLLWVLTAIKREKASLLLVKWGMFRETLRQLSSFPGNAHILEDSRAKTVNTLPLRAAKEVIEPSTKWGRSLDRVSFLLINHQDSFSQFEYRKGWKAEEDATYIYLYIKIEIKYQRGFRRIC